MAIKNNLNFKYTPQIRRYLTEMLDYWNECRKSMLPSRIQFEEPLEIDSYLDHEKGNQKEQDNLLNFFKWLENENAVKFTFTTEDNSYVSKKSDEEIVYPTTFNVNVRDNRPIIKLLEQFELENTNFKTDDNGRFLFFEDSTGKFRWGAKRIDLKANETFPYYKYLVAIYLSADEDGNTSVSEIQRILRYKFKTKKSITRKDVQNHINNSINRLLRGRLPEHTHMFKWTKGTDKLFFNNPKLMIEG